MRALSLDRMTRELKQSQQKGLLRAKRVMVRLRGRVLRAYRAGQYEISFVPQVYAELVPITAEAMTIAHFAGIRRSYLMLPRDLRLSLRDDVEGVLGVQFESGDIEIVRKMYSLEATRALGEDARAVERRIEKTMLEIVSSGAHVREGVKILSAEMAGLGISTHRLETIFRTQTQLAYSAARWNADQDEATQEILWGYEYATVGDDRVRDEHEVLDGTKLPKDHSFWQAGFYPFLLQCQQQHSHDRLHVSCAALFLGGLQAIDLELSVYPQAHNHNYIPSTDRSIYAPISQSE